VTRHSELSRSDILTDPLIRQLMRADRVSRDELASLMERAAARLHNGKKSKHSGNRDVKRG
jgi:hypothetical protein